MTITETTLPGVLLVTPKIFRDNRGAFCETWNQRLFAEAGLPTEWVQDNASFSAKNVMRGIHYQIVQPQAKLVRVTSGVIVDVAVDLRRTSPHFGKHVAVELDAEKSQMLYIPVGFGHGFAALTDGVGLAYKVTDYYCPQGERTIVWNDPDLAIRWPLTPQAAILSDKDLKGSSFRDAELFA